MSLAAVRLANRRPEIYVGWFWFLGLLAPVIGLVRWGSQSMADRFAYLPLVGILVMVVWGAAAGSERGRAIPDYLFRWSRYVASASNACTRPRKIFNDANALSVRRRAIRRDFSRPTMDG